MRKLALSWCGALFPCCRHCCCCCASTALMTSLYCRRRCTTLIGFAHAACRHCGASTASGAACCRGVRATTRGSRASMQPTWRCHCTRAVLTSSSSWIQTPRSWQHAPRGLQPGCRPHSPTDHCCSPTHRTKAVPRCRAAPPSHLRSTLSPTSAARALRSVASPPCCRASTRPLTHVRHLPPSPAISLPRHLPPSPAPCALAPRGAPTLLPPAPPCPHQPTNSTA